MDVKWTHDPVSANCLLKALEILKSPMTNYIRSSRKNLPKKLISVVSHDLTVDRAGSLVILVTTSSESTYRARRQLYFSI